MANDETIATPEDRAIQLRRFQNAKTRLAVKAVGYCVGWGFEADYLDAHKTIQTMRLNTWLRFWTPQWRF